ncbi:MAG: mechanosensitive ion channel protein MscS, partial [Bradyrhizobium sp.]|nr:mechanosensitive ion channel protein MscS [Bradyrhizobium sp.]
MDFDLKDVLELLQTVARSIGAEVTSPWFYLQLGLVLSGAGIAFATSAAVRARIDVTSLALGWPGPLRQLLRVLLESVTTVVFVILMRIARTGMVLWTWPSRSYLLAVALKLAMAWLVIRLITSVIRNTFIVQIVSISAWLVAA